jgi:hypothetical protein
VHADFVKFRRCEIFMLGIYSKLVEVWVVSRSDTLAISDKFDNSAGTFGS